MPTTTPPYVYPLLRPPPPAFPLPQVRGMREECAADGRPPTALVWVRPSDSLAAVVRRLFAARVSSAPVLSAEPGAPGCTVLYIASLGGVLACLMRHFRASLASLPLLAQPLATLPLGTWAPDSQWGGSGGAGGGGAGASPGTALANGVLPGGGKSAPGERTVAPLHAVTPSTPLISALGLLLDAGVRATASSKQHTPSPRLCLRHASAS